MRQACDERQACELKNVANTVLENYVYKTSMCSVSQLKTNNKTGYAEDTPRKLLKSEQLLSTISISTHANSIGYTNNNEEMFETQKLFKKHLKLKLLHM